VLEEGGRDGQKIKKIWKIISAESRRIKTKLSKKKKKGRRIPVF
jgi:hypothetical protein